MKLTTEEIIEHAHAAALHFRTLVDAGVPAPVAQQMSSSFVTALVLTKHTEELEVRQPWDVEE